MKLTRPRPRPTETALWLRWSGHQLSRLLGWRDQLHTVAVHELRCQRKPYSELQGFAGRPIDEFPPCRFFGDYLDSPDRARRDFAAWYEEWFLRRQAWRVPKSEGGMRGGSLARTVAALYRCRYGGDPEDMATVSADVIQQAIEIRVAHYFELLESISQRGFVPWLGPPIRAVLEGGRLYLENGHHRAAILRVLGIPEVDVVVRS